MRFTNGFWLARPGVRAHFAQEAYELAADDGALVVIAPTKRITTRGDTLNLPVLTVTVAPHLPGVLRVGIEHHTGGGEPTRFEVAEPVVRCTPHRRPFTYRPNARWISRLESRSARSARLS